MPYKNLNFIFSQNAEMSLTSMPIAYREFVERSLEKLKEQPLNYPEFKETKKYGKVFVARPSQDVRILFSKAKGQINIIDITKPGSF